MNIYFPFSCKLETKNHQNGDAVLGILCSLVFVELYSHFGGNWFSISSKSAAKTIQIGRPIITGFGKKFQSQKREKPAGFPQNAAPFLTNVLHHFWQKLGQHFADFWISVWRKSGPKNFTFRGFVFRFLTELGFAFYGFCRQPVDTHRRKTCFS